MALEKFPESIDLTLPAVVQVIEDVLGDYPEQPYQLFFSIHEFRQKLITHILNQTPSIYTAEAKSEAKNPHSSPVAQRLHLEVLVRGSILKVLRENADQLDDRFSPKKAANYSLWQTSVSMF